MVIVTLVIVMVMVVVRICNQLVIVKRMVRGGRWR